VPGRTHAGPHPAPEQLRALLLTWEGGTLGLCGQVLAAGGYRGGFCEKLLEASPMCNGANASQLQDRPTTAKAEPSAMVVAPLRELEKGKNNLHNGNFSQRKECERKNSVEPAVIAEGGQEVLQAP